MLGLIREVFHTVWYALTVRTYSLSSMSPSERQRARAMMWGAGARLSGVTKIEVCRGSISELHDWDEGR